MLYGLIGKPLSHSKSAELFQERFKDNHQYKLYELKHLNELHDLIRRNTDLMGLNVTIPYKKDVMAFLNEVELSACEIGAVNTISIKRTGIGYFLKGYNTDYLGFEKAYTSILLQNHTFALILGTGGASMAVAYVLKKFHIPFCFVSRNTRNASCVLYEDLEKTEKTVSLIINTTPVGMYPHDDETIKLSSCVFEHKPYFIDLVYNPLITRNMIEAEKYGCETENGLKMLKKQAEESWKIWGL